VLAGLAAGQSLRLREPAEAAGSAASDGDKAGS
jgi:hypothetical protein